MDANATLSSQQAGSVTPPAKPAASIHPQRKESHGKALPKARTQAQPVQKEALLTVILDRRDDGIGWVNRWSNRNAGLEYTGI